MDLDSLDLEVVDKEMVVDEAAQSAIVAPEENVPEPTQTSGNKADAWFYPCRYTFFLSFFLSFFLFLGA